MTIDKTKAAPQPNSWVREFIRQPDQNKLLKLALSTLAQLSKHPRFPSKL